MVRLISYSLTFKCWGSTAVVFLVVSHFAKVFTRSLSYQTIYVMKGNYMEKKNIFLILHTFLCENYNSGHWYVFLEYLKICSLSSHGLLWILISIKLSIDWGINHQILRDLNFWWPENCAILNLADIMWLKQISRWTQALKSFK